MNRIGIGNSKFQYFLRCERVSRILSGIQIIR